MSDTATGLQWQDDSAAASTRKSWIEAIDYCESLPLDGGGWRLPNKKELFSIVDLSRYNPAINSNVFQNYSSSYYWSSTTSANNSDGVWYVRFGDGGSGNVTKTTNTNVRCVRGGQ